MGRKFQIEGIRCGGCMTRAKRALEEHPAVEETQIFLQPKGAMIISMKEELNGLEGYTITEAVISF